MKEYAFDAVINQRQGMNAGYIEFPYNVEEEFGIMGRVPIKASFDGVPYRGSLVKMGTDCHIAGLTKEIREQIGKSFGDMVHVVLTHDTEPRVVEIPSEVKRAMDKHPAVKRVFDKLSYTHQNEYVRWITAAKKKETKERRLAKMIDMLSEGINHP